MFVKANLNEFLVVGRRGRLMNRGVGGRAILWPGTGYTLVPSTKKEACFALTQETKDGIPLRFKGIVIYRVTVPEEAAKLFDFAGGSGHEEIESLICHICMGELRAVVSHMTMAECIEQRESTLTDAVASTLRRVVQGESREGSPSSGWGIELDVVQVAQVYIIDDELRRHLEAEVRNGIRGRSELSQIRTNEVVRRAQIVSERDLEEESLKTERKRNEIAEEKIRLQKDLERREIESDAPVRLLRTQKEIEVLLQDLDMRRLENQVKELRVHGEMLEKKAAQDLRREILPLEQAPAIAQSLSGILQGVNLSIIGDDSKLLACVISLFDTIAGRLRKSGMQ